ncbi:MAG: 5-(carboxyamino)imidazole ribonucleotide synthase [Solirubrobacteraceae bacterium]|nr:5-(carboxyamino)imidazole ribonucleotide synthase [Solirubrobacteraceae bacterium]
MVGAGQLARMTHRAAIDLGIELVVLASSPGDSAVQAGARAVIGSADSAADLRALAEGADVVTFDHEQVPPELLAELAGEGLPLQPAPAAKLLAQDKLYARRELSARGFPVPPFALANGENEISAFAAEHGWPIVAKAPRGGYDGRGVSVVEGPEEAAALLAESPDGLLLEPLLPIERELAVVVARSTNGEARAYPVAETVQRDAMCREILVPAPVDAAIAEEARELALAITDVPGASGIIALELFLVDGRLVVNELALRPHNSGHFTIEGAETSQFEQHLRGVLGWPLGVTELTAPAVAMVNVVGPADGSDPRERLPRALAEPGVHVHLYDKAPAPGRKLGHVTVRADDLDSAVAAARRAAAILEGEG